MNQMQKAPFPAAAFSGVAPATLGKVSIPHSAVIFILGQCGPPGRYNDFSITGDAPGGKP
jgi:hypothetical protein